MAGAPPYPPTWQGYMSESIMQPPDHSVAALDDLSFPVPQFTRGEEFYPGPFQKGFTPAAYDALGWGERQEDEVEDELWEHWADESNLVETLQWFDQPPLYHNPSIPREWQAGDHFGGNTRPIAFADFRDPRAQQYVHERACGPMMKRRITCMAQAQTDPYKSCIRWIDAEARCFQSIFCKKELVEFEQCTEGGNPALGPLCTEYQAALNSCMTKIEVMWSEQKASYWYPDDDLDLEPMPGGLHGRDFDNKKLTQFENMGRPGWALESEVAAAAAEDDREMYETFDDEDEEWDIDEPDYKEEDIEDEGGFEFMDENFIDDDEDDELDLEGVDEDEIVRTVCSGS